MAANDAGEEMKDGEQGAESKDAEEEEAKGEDCGDEGRDGEQYDAGKSGPKGEANDEAEEYMDEEPEEPKEVEEDAPDDKRPRLEDAVGVNALDSTMNVTPTCGGKVLMSLSDGGFQYLLAGARANTGMKDGRYFYEVRIVESKNPLDPTAKQQGQRTPRQVCCLGFALKSSSLFLGDGEDSVGFDSEGNFLSGKSRTRISSRFMPYTQVFGVLLNLDAKSPNAHTISLFRDGLRMCKPKPIPECLKGKVLYPLVNYKNMTLHLNFGPGILAPLPFRCLNLQQAAAADVERNVPTAPDDGRCQVIFPVGLPDEGTFDWLDDFLKRNPHYVELSSRAILEWGLKSGLWRQRGSFRNCNDRPTMEFGIRELDDDTIRQMIQSIAPVLKRNFVVMEVRNNLLPRERGQMLANFDSADFKRVAMVVMGEPTDEHKARVRQLILHEKRQRAVADVKRRRAEVDHRRPPPPPASKPYDPEAVDGEDAKKDSEKEPESKETEEPLEEAVRKAEESVELTKEEEGLWFRKSMVEDLTKKELGQHFSKFTLPAKEDGFDDIQCPWQPLEKCEQYLKVWISERKLTQRVEELQPGQWFREQFTEWTRLLQEWRRKHGEWRDPNRRWQPEKRRREEQEDGGEEKKDEEGMMEDGKQGEPNDAEPKVEDKDSTSLKEETKAEDMDVFFVEDICDVCNGEPLFANFTWEDWMLLSLRFEVHLLVHAYCHDMNDPERTSFHETHLGFYYNKYYKKQFNLKYYGVNTELELLELIKDTIEVAPKNSILDPQLAHDTPMENFVKLTEDHRRERQRKIDAGDESAMLKFQKPPPRGQQGGGNRGGYQSRGPPPAPYARGIPPNSRMAPPSGTPSRYSSGGGGARGGSGGYGAGGTGGYGSRGGAPPSRYGSMAPAPPPSRSYGNPPPSYGGGGQKRSYAPPSSSSYPPYKQPRGGSSYGSGPPPSRGSYGSSGGYGGGGGGYSGYR